MTESAAPGGGLAVFDLDGTITRSDTLVPFVLGYLRRSPWRLVRLVLVLPAAVRFVLGRAHDPGQLKGALIHATLGGVSRAALARWTGCFVARLLRRGVYHQAIDAIGAHRTHGDRLVLMSASTDLYVPQIGHALGFDQVICTPVRWRDDGRLDGRLAGSNCRGKEKHRRLQGLIERDAPARVYTYGNSRADLAHMELAQQAYLINGPACLNRALGANVRRVRWRH